MIAALYCLIAQIEVIAAHNYTAPWKGGIGTMDHKVKGMTLALALLLAALCTIASAQSTSWRVPNYGVEFSVSGIAPQSLAIDSDGSVYAFVYIGDLNRPKLRLSHYQAAVGEVMWHDDLDAVPVSPGTIAGTVATASIAAVGADVAVASTNRDTQFYGRVARYRGSDGALVWEQSERTASDLMYAAIAVDSVGSVVVAGASGQVNATALWGHVAKIHGGDGSPAWAVDLDPAACGAGPIYAFHLTSVVVDAHDDVFVAGSTGSEYGFAFCAFKLSGTNGGVQWSYAYRPHDASVSAQSAVTVAIGGDDNPAFGSGYYSSSTNPNYAFGLVKVDGVAGTKVWSIDTVVVRTQTFLDAAIAADAAGNVFLSAGSAGTRAYASADGHMLWPEDAPEAGIPAIDSSGNIVIAQNVALDPYVMAGRKINFYRLDSSSGTQLWNTSFALGTVGYWDYRNLVVTDASGQFAALQALSELCCEEKQSLLIHGSVADGSFDWHLSDHDAAQSNAIQFEPDPVFTRMSASTPDGGIVGAGTSYLGDLQNARGPADRITVIKRSLIDGHLLWRATPDFGLDYCVPSSLVVDGNGDVVVGGSCNGKGQTIKFGGSDGQLLWATSKQDGCDYARVESVSVDPANDVYATGDCQASGTDGQITVKLSGSTGIPSWQKLTAATPSSYSQFLVAADASGGVVIAGTGNATGDPNSAAVSLVVNKLHAVDGSPVWSQHFDPPIDGFESLAALGLYANGDVAVAGIESAVTSTTLAARLRAVDGAVKWETHDTAPEMIGVTPSAMALDAQGNVLLAGAHGVWKYGGATGARSWTLHGLPGSVTGTFLNDVIAAPDGSVAATGACASVGRSVPNLCVVDIASATGVPVWTAIDLPVEPGYSVGIGIVAGPDGAMVVSGDFALPNASPWSLLRIAGPGTDDLFPNGFEP